MSIDSEVVLQILRRSPQGFTPFEILDYLLTQPQYQGSSRASLFTKLLPELQNLRDSQVVAHVSPRWMLVKAVDKTTEELSDESKDAVSSEETSEIQASVSPNGSDEDPHTHLQEWTPQVGDKVLVKGRGSSLFSVLRLIYIGSEIYAELSHPLGPKSITIKKPFSELILADYKELEQKVTEPNNAESTLAIKQETSDVVEVSLDVPIERLNLSLRAFNCLKKAGINTVRELQICSDEDLLELKNFGQTSLSDVRSALASFQPPPAPFQGLRDAPQSYLDWLASLSKSTQIEVLAKKQWTPDRLRELSPQQVLSAIPSDARQTTLYALISGQIPSRRFATIAEEIDDVLDSLNDRNKIILKQRLGLQDGNRRSLEDIGQELELTRERVRQIVDKAINKLNAPNKESILIQFRQVAIILAWYLRIILATSNNDSNPGLVELAASLSIPTEFLELSASDLIRLAYAYHTTTTLQTPQAVDRLLWLPRLSSDHLEILQSTLTLLQQDQTSWKALLKRAEQLLTLEQLSDLVQQLIATTQEIASRTDLSGIWVAAVCIAIEQGRPLEEFDVAVYTPRSLQGDYCDVAQTLQQALAVSQKVDIHLSEQCPTFNDISTLLDWYRSQNIHTQELEISRAIRSVLKLNQLPGQLREKIIEQLQNLRSHWRDFLNLLDEKLADLVTGSQWSKFCHHPRHSTQVLSDILPSQLPRDSRVWFLIFDGMRLDSWDLVVRPILEDHFQITEKLYLTSLPSITDIARVALIAGGTPDKWKNASGLTITNHNILAAKKLGISYERRQQDLQIVVRSETLERQLRLGLGEEDAKKYNILIISPEKNRSRKIQYAGNFHIITFFKF